MRRSDFLSSPTDTHGSFPPARPASPVLAAARSRATVMLRIRTAAPATTPTLTKDTGPSTARLPSRSLKASSTLPEAAAAVGLVRQRRPRSRLRPRQRRRRVEEAWPTMGSAVGRVGLALLPAPRPTRARCSRSGIPSACEHRGKPYACGLQVRIASCLEEGSCSPVSR